MDLALLLPWFPIILAVGVGGRLLGPARGIGLGVVCAVFWIFLMQASFAAGYWEQPWHVVAALAGAAAIVAMGAWAGEMAGSLPQAQARVTQEGSPTQAGEPTPTRSLARVSTLLGKFEGWMAEHGDDPDPWPQFDELIRRVLNQCCHASHVKPYRVVSNGQALAPLRAVDDLQDAHQLPTRRGIIGHVFTSGSSYLAGDPTQGEMVAKLAEASDNSTVWCFPIAQGNQRLGVVAVGRLEPGSQRDRSLLKIVEQLVSLYWGRLDDAQRSRRTGRDDPASGLLTRKAFLQVGRQTLRNAYRLSEPVALAVIGLESLRQLNDSGGWDVADELVREVAGLVKEKVRSDDRLARYDESRFIVLLRRVDSELATLILTQLITRLETLCADEKRWGFNIRVRCGLVGSGTGQPELKTLMTDAVALCQRARHDDVTMTSDLQSEIAVGSAGL